MGLIYCILSSSVSGIDLPLLEGEQWDDRGKKDTTIHVIFCIFNLIFDFYDVMLKCEKMSCQDVGISQLVGASPI